MTRYRSTSNKLLIIATTIICCFETVYSDCYGTPRARYGTYICDTYGPFHYSGDRCVLHCNTGYVPSISNSVLTCHSRDRWTGTFSDCQLVNCPTPSVPSAKATFSCSTQQHYAGSVCTVWCNDGLVTETGEQSQSIHCEANGKWTAHPTCADQHCSPPPSVKFGTYVCSTGYRYSQGTTCQIYCSSGHRVSGTGSITCASTKQWVASGTSSCVESQCSAPPEMENGKYVCPSSTYSHGTVCHLQCQEGYRPVTDNANITCLQTDDWSAATSCVEGCPKGTFMNITQSVDNSTVTTVKKCEPCPRGTYQENAGTDTCLPCPPGWSTPTAGTTDVSLCKSVCHPGTISPDGLEPCHLCRVGFYQDQSGSTTCIKCPPGQTTSNVGSSRTEHCVAI